MSKHLTTRKMAFSRKRETRKQRKESETERERQTERMRRKNEICDLDRERYRVGGGTNIDVKQLTNYFMQRYYYY